MSGSLVRFEIDARVATITISRPDKLNALSHAVLGELQEAFARAGSDAGVGAVLLTGEGDKAFVAGADIAELARQTPLSGARTAREGQEILRRIEQLPKPVIAAINGFALGGGLELALACHLRVASQNAALGLPELTLGIIPGYGGTQRLARLIGRARATEMILTGRRVAAEEAERWGLVNRVVPAGQALGAARELALAILANGPIAVGLALEAIGRGLEMPLSEGEAFEASLFGLVSTSEDMREGLKAFLEKRKPQFQGR